MEAQVIPGFSALEFKEEAQTRVYDDTKDMTPEERLRYFREAVDTGPFAERWRRLPRAAAPREDDATEPEPIAA